MVVYRLTVWFVNCSNTDGLRTMLARFLGGQRDNKPEGALCSVHPGGNGGGGVYVDLSIL